ncbi:hypothetical protein CFOL_v3_08515 [Cephalotus follicularis]|uniref:Uncharacterized protein n=1 Tax=Cephalotus follicularis TaxID=3775 RepID=A0A1Q3BAG7_CEPFO|nr:hypothetical protein CFOL_v3_08515 [Cephalotus follicularis]
MSLIGQAIRSNLTLKTMNPNNGVSLFLRESSKRFSTESEQPPPTQDSSVDQFIRNVDRGVVYGKFGVTSKHLLKTDVINLLELQGRNLTVDDVKINYTRNFTPVGVLMRFPSRDAFDDAFRALNKKGRLYRLEKADREQWDLITPYNGRTILLQGIPRNASADDVERFLSGCNYDASTLEMFVRPGFPDPIRMAMARFPSQTQAMNAFIRKNRGFCLNNQILVRVLQ